MKISEAVERECCQVEDMRKYQGTPIPGASHPRFCVHCGQLFWFNRQNVYGAAMAEKLYVNQVTWNAGKAEGA